MPIFLFLLFTLFPLALTGAPVYADDGRAQIPSTFTLQKYEGGGAGPRLAGTIDVRVSGNTVTFSSLVTPESGSRPQAPAWTLVIDENGGPVRLTEGTREIGYRQPAGNPDVNFYHDFQRLRFFLTGTRSENGRAFSWLLSLLSGVEEAMIRDGSAIRLEPSPGLDFHPARVRIERRDFLDGPWDHITRECEQFVVRLYDAAGTELYFILFGRPVQHKRYRILDGQAGRNNRDVFAALLFKDEPRLRREFQAASGWIRFEPVPQEDGDRGAVTFELLFRGGQRLKGTAGAAHASVGIRGFPSPSSNPRP